MHCTLHCSFEKKELITDEDGDCLIKLNSVNSAAASSHLYEILKSKTYGYVGVMEALLHGANLQTGAWKILKCGEQTYLNSPEILGKQIQQLLSLPIQLSGKISRLKDIFPNFTSENASGLLRNADINRELNHTMAQQSPVLILNAEVPHPHPLHTERSMSNRLILDPTIFRLQRNDVFVFKGVTRTELLKLVDPHVMRSSTEQRSIITCKRIHLDDDEDWDDLVEVAESPIHLVQMEGKDFVLMRSSKISSNICSYDRSKEKNESAYISEDTFVDQLASSSKGSLICDIPGMGKTWLMENLARKLRLTHQIGEAHVFFVQLAPFSKYLEEAKQGMAELNALQFILEYVSKSKIVSHILTERMKNNKDTKGIFFLDGFDEVADDYVQKTTCFLQYLNGIANINLVISSRPSMRSHLEETFGVISYDILPFQRQEQIRYVTEIWQQRLPNSDPDVLKEFANHCISSIRRVQKNDSREILGVPLRCYILAVINEKRAKLLSKRHRKKPIIIAEEATSYSIFTLYDKFVEVSMQKVASENKGISWSLHTLRALEILFPEIAEEYKKTMKLQNILIPRAEVAQVGLLWQDQQLCPEFIHRSFAEYFLGKFIAKFCVNMSCFGPSFIEKTGGYIMEQILKMSAEGMGLYLQSTTRVRFSFDIYPKEPNHNWQANPVMMFMNSTGIREDEISNGTQWTIFKQLLENKSDSIKILQNGKDSIRNKVYGCIFACVNKRLGSVLAVVVDIVKVFFEEAEIPGLLIVPETLFKTSSTFYTPYKDFLEASVPAILYYASYYGSPEAANLLFKLFSDSDSNYLKRFCQNYPLKYWSPLEVAITKNDIDMFLYFSNKMSIPKERLLVRCLQLEQLILPTETCVDRRILMFQSVLDHASISPELMMQDFTAYLMSVANQQENILQQCMMFLLNNKISLRMFPLNVYMISLNPLELLSVGGGDEEMIQFLLVMFRKPCCSSVRVESASATVLPRQTPQGYRAEEVLRELNLRKARKILKRNFKINLCLQNIHNLETLRVLLGIFPSLVPFSECKLDYLHYSVLYEKFNWVEYLIQCGHDVNKQDKLGMTPLFCVNGRQSVEITRLLVENGADVNVVDTEEQSVAHIVLEIIHRRYPEDVIEWVNFMLHKTEYRLWCAKDKRGNTPLDSLTSLVGSEHSLTKAVRARIEKQTVVMLVLLLTSIVILNVTNHYVLNN